MKATKGRKGKTDHGLWSGDTEKGLLSGKKRKRRGSRFANGRKQEGSKSRLRVRMGRKGKRGLERKGQEEFSKIFLIEMQEGVGEEGGRPMVTRSGPEKGTGGGALFHPEKGGRGN